MGRMRAGTWIAGLAVAGVLMTGGVARADTWQVTTTGDPQTGSTCPSSNCSLRQAAATAPDGTVIQFQDPGTYTVDAGAPIVVPFGVTIDGGSPGRVTIDGSGNRDHAHNDTPYRIFTTQAAGTRLANLTLTGGDDGGDETCPTTCSTLNATGGGAIWNTGGLTLDHVRLVGNGAPVGGAISSSGTLDLTDVTISQNRAGLGGGLFVRGGTVTVRRSLFDHDGDGGYGGGAVYLYGGTLAMSDSTVAGSGWASSLGGGIENFGGSLTLTGVTLADNLRGAIMTDSGATTTVTDTLIGAGFNAGSDFACARAGIDREAGKKTVAAITTDGGHNLDEDGGCGLTGTGDLTGDAHLAPLADNGGAAPTFALLHDSPALDAGSACSATDQRGIERPQGLACDIGAFEAVRTGAPAATTGAATDIGTTGATLNATVDLHGEAGGAHFTWGTAPDRLSAETEVGASGQGTTASVALGGLQPKTTYYFAAVADNATGAGPAGNVLSFTTAAAPPAVTDLGVQDVTDTTAKLAFTIDPGGADTTYVVKYGLDVPSRSTEPVDVGAQAGPQQLTATLTGLEPGTTYQIAIVATNAEGSAGGDQTVQATAQRQVAGQAGGPVTITDSGDFGVCPAPTVDWGDGAVTGATVTCHDDGEDGQAFDLTASHAYAAGGHYPVVIDYGGEAGQRRQWAQVAASLPPTPTPTPTATPSPTPTPTATPTPPPAPAFHRQVVVRPVSGTVLVKLKGAKTFVPVDAATGVPLGSQVDVTHGRIRLTSVPRPGGKPQTAVFYAGIFTVTQPGSVTQLTLSGPKPTCTSRGKASAAAARKKVRSRKLWGDGHGSFRTKGQYSAATVRGTQWLVEDTCAGTLTRVVHGLVSVRDSVRRKTVLVRGGTRYLARPRRH